MINRVRAFSLVELLVVLAIIFIFVSLGPIAFFEAPLRLIFGWIAFLARNIPSMTWSGEGITMFALLIVAITVLAYAVANHWFQGFGRAISCTTPLFAVLMIVALFAAGIGATGVSHQVGWLVTSPEPWLKGSGAAIYRMQDSNNLKLMALSLHNFDQSLSLLSETPTRETPGFARSTIRSPDGVLMHGWHTALLPYLEEQALFEQIELSRAWNDPVNRPPMATSVPYFLRIEYESDRLPKLSGSYAVTHLAGNRLIFGDARIERFSDVTDGLSSTIMAGNAAGQFLPWGHPLGWRGSEFTPNEDDRGFGSGHQGGCHVIMADGAVKFVTDSIDRKLWSDLFTPQGGEEIENRF